MMESKKLAMSSSYINLKFIHIKKKIKMLYKYCRKVHFKDLHKNNLNAQTL